MRYQNVSLVFVLPANLNQYENPEILQGTKCKAIYLFVLVFKVGT